MKTIVLNTDLRCEHYISKIKPLLDNAENVSNWEVDLATLGHPIKVEGEISKAGMGATIGQSRI